MSRVVSYESFEYYPQFVFYTKRKPNLKLAGITYSQLEFKAIKQYL